MNQYFPQKYFENVKEGALEIYHYCSGLAVANNQLLVAAVTGKRIQVVSGVAYSTGAFTQIFFKSNSGGAQLKSFALPANTSDTPNVNFCVSPIEMFETATGHGLYIDVIADVPIVSINYIIYTP